METNSEERSGFTRFDATGTPEQGQPVGSDLTSSPVALGRQLMPSLGARRGLLVRGGRSREQPNASTGGLTLAVIAVGSVLAAAAVAYAAAVNPHSAPAGPAGWLARAAYVLSPAMVGVYAWHLHPEERLGRLLVALAAAATVWALTGASDPALFGVARLVGVFVAPFLSYVVLSFPEGWLHSRSEKWVVASSTAVIAVCWVPLVFITAQPVIASPLIRCAPHCPHNAFFVGASPGLARILEVGVRFGYAVMLVGVVVLLLRRLVTSTVPMRRMLMPAFVASIVYAGGLAFFLAAQSHGTNMITVSGWVVIVAIPLIPVALLLGLVRERAFVRSALVRLVTALPGLKDGDQVRTAMAAAFSDDSLQIFFWRAADRCYVDRDGNAVDLPKGPATAVTALERNGDPVAAVVYDSALGEDARFIRAIAETAMLGVDKTKLESDLQRSQLRLVQTASLTRERLARDLHDGAQQHLVAALLRLDLAADAVDAGSEDGAAMVRRIAIDLEDALDALRRLSHGMSPPLLAQRGLEPALAASALRSTIPVTVTATGIRRYSPEVEAAVYFSCVEALQNAAKHAGPQASITLTLSDDHRSLRFEVADTGVGFDARVNGSGNGLTHIRDRIGAVGGQVAISSTPNQGTSISATIPIAETAASQSPPSAVGGCGFDG